MYNELIKELRIYANDETDEIRFKAADAIEQLIEERDAYRKAMTHEHNRAANLAWEKEHCWIPVTERLPEHGWYLVYGPTIKMEVLHYHSAEEVWSSKRYYNIEVTHWMPLPEPPKEE